MARDHQQHRFPSLTPASDEVRELADRIEARRGQRVSLTDVSRRLVDRALRLYADIVEQPTVDPRPFTVEVWHPEQEHLLEVIARVNHQGIALAAFDEAARLMPSQRLLCRHGVHTMREHLPAPPAAPAVVAVPDREEDRDAAE